jgi:hypothetical protein
MIKDAQGHILSGASADSTALFDQAIRAFNLFHGDPLGLIDAALKVSPEFVMAHLSKAWMLNLQNDPTLDRPASEIIEVARRMPMNEREHGHLVALALTAERARRAALTVLDRHLMSYPHDIVAHQASTLIGVYSGHIPSCRERSARALPLWSKDMPGYATLLGFYGFGLEEGSEYARAEDVSRESLDHEPNGFIPHHTVAHCLEMTGRPEDGLGWMAAREEFWGSQEDGLRSHVWWHKSLFHIELGQLKAALAVYDGPLLATMRPLGTRLTDPVALLWRLDLLDCDLGNRWRDLLPLLHGHSDGKCLVFTDVHAAMAELRSGNEALVDRRLDWCAPQRPENQRQLRSIAMSEYHWWKGSWLFILANMSAPFR